MTAPPVQPTTLRRELGKWDLTALGVNQVIGGGIFLMPAILAASVGGWGWIAVGMVGVLALLIALCFAEAGSRFDGTGGPYLYTREAFGRFAGFEIGWMLWVTRVTSWASILNGLVTALGYYWPRTTTGGARIALITFVVVAITAINLRGIKTSAIVVNTLTIGKLLPLTIFIVAGLPFVSWSALVPAQSVDVTQGAAAALYIIFAFGGFEVLSVPAGEARNPKRDVPFAMVTTIVIVGIVMMLVQIVAMGTLPNVVASRTPLADAAAVFLGGAGALLLTVGATISMTGNNLGGAIAGSRVLYALAEQRDLPKPFSALHPRYRTPYFTIVFTSAATLLLALTGSFATLAQTSGVARLLVYAGTCAAVLVLRRQGRAPFTIPGGPVIPAMAVVLSLAILYGITALQFRVGIGALVAGAVLYAVARRRHS
jgi:basic amino acid/polyamine antiporter, APA family